MTTNETERLWTPLHEPPGADLHAGLSGGTQIDTLSYQIPHISVRSEAFEVLPQDLNHFLNGWATDVWRLVAFNELSSDEL